MRTLASLLFVMTALITLGCEMDAPIAQGDGGMGDGATCMIECAAPPAGCSWEGGDACTTCGTLVCMDGGGCATPVDCAAPPAGCHYEGGDGCTTCGTLVCDVMCGGTTSSFPDFDRSCAAASDCVVVEHQVDCCGTFHALGIRADQETAFDEAEALCRGMYPGCGCAGGPTMADDGTVFDGSRAARVECVAGQCTSTHGLESGATCTPGGDPCGAGLSCCYPCGIAGCDNVCEPTCDPGDAGCVDGCTLRA